MSKGWHGGCYIQVEGSFLIPGGRQRQTLSPLLNPAGYPGLILLKTNPKSKI